jgi:hypothetical protein
MYHIIQSLATVIICKSGLQEMNAYGIVQVDMNILLDVLLSGGRALEEDRDPRSPAGRGARGMDHSRAGAVRKQGLPSSTDDLAPAMGAQGLGDCVQRLLRRSGRLGEG